MEGAEESDEAADNHEEEEAARAQKAFGFLRTRSIQSLTNKRRFMKKPAYPVINLVSKKGPS